MKEDNREDIVNESGGCSIDSNRKAVYVSTFCSDYFFGFPAKLEELSDWLAIRAQEVPEEYRSQASIEITPFDEYGDLGLRAEISYERPETDIELRDRILREERRARQKVQDHHKAYLKIKSKIEGGSQ